jgi:hypothetical protein
MKLSEWIYQKSYFLILISTSVVMLGCGGSSDQDPILGSLGTQSLPEVTLTSPVKSIPRATAVAS